MAASSKDFSSKAATIMTVLECGKKIIGTKEAKYYNELAKIWEDLLKEYAASEKLIDPILHRFFTQITEGKIPKFDIPASIERGEQKIPNENSGDPKYDDYQRHIRDALMFLEEYEEVIQKGDTWISRNIWINLSYTLVGNQYAIHAMDYLLRHICFYYSPIEEKQFDRFSNTLQFISDFIEKFAIRRRDNHYKKGYQQLFGDLKLARDVLKKYWSKQIATQKLDGIKKEAKSAGDCLRLALILVYPNMLVIAKRNHIRLEDLKKGIILKPLTENQKLIELPKKESFLFYENLMAVIQSLDLSDHYPGDKTPEQKDDAFGTSEMISFPTFTEKEKDNYIDTIRSRLFPSENFFHLMGSTVAKESNKLTTVDVIEFNDRVKIVEDLLNLALALNDLVKLAALSSRAAHNHGQLAILNEEYYDNLFNSINAICAYSTKKIKMVAEKLHILFESLKSAEGDFKINEVISFYKSLLDSIKQKVNSCDGLISELEDKRVNFEGILEESRQNDKELEEALHVIGKRYAIKVISREKRLMRSLESKPEDGGEMKAQFQLTSSLDYSKLTSIYKEKEKVHMITSKEIKKVPAREPLASSSLSSENSSLNEPKEQVLQTNREGPICNEKFSSLVDYLNTVADSLLESPTIDLKFFNDYYNKVFGMLDKVERIGISEEERKNFLAEYNISMDNFPGYVRNYSLIRWLYDTEYKRGQLLVNHLVVSSVCKKLKEKKNKEHKAYEGQVKRYNNLLKCIETDAKRVMDTLSSNRLVDWWRGRIKNQFEFFLRSLKKELKLSQSDRRINRQDIPQLAHFDSKPSPLVSVKEKEKKPTLLLIQGHASKECLFQPSKEPDLLGPEDKAILDLADASYVSLTNLQEGTDDPYRLIPEAYRCILSFWQALVEYGKARDHSLVEEKLKEKIMAFHEHPLIKIPENPKCMSPLAQSHFKLTLPEEDFFDDLIHVKLRTINSWLKTADVVFFLKTELVEKLTQLKASPISTMNASRVINAAN